MLRFVSFSGLRSNNKEFPFPFSFLLRVEKRVFFSYPCFFVFFYFFCFSLLFASSPRAPATKRKLFATELPLLTPGRNEVASAKLRSTFQRGSPSRGCAVPPLFPLCFRSTDFLFYNYVHYLSISIYLRIAQSIHKQWIFLPPPSRLVSCEISEYDILFLEVGNVVFP